MLTVFDTDDVAGNFAVIVGPTTIPEFAVFDTTDAVTAGVAIVFEANCVVVVDTTGLDVVASAVVAVAFD